MYQISQKIQTNLAYAFFSMLKALILVCVQLYTCKRLPLHICRHIKAPDRQKNSQPHKNLITICSCCMLHDMMACNMVIPHR